MQANMKYLHSIVLHVNEIGYILGFQLILTKDYEYNLLTPLFKDALMNRSQ